MSQIQLTVKPSELIAALKAIREAEGVPFLTSKPGMGKTTITKQFSNFIGGSFYHLPMPTLTPMDIIGFPRLHGDKMVFTPPALLPGPDAVNPVILLDEITKAPPLTRNLGLQLFQFKRVLDWKAPEGTFIVAAGNRVQDRSGDVNLGQALNRRLYRIELCPDLDGWFLWASVAGIDSRIMAWLRFKPETFAPDAPRDWDGETQVSNPAAWEEASKLVAVDPPKALRARLLYGKLGPVGLEVDAFLDVCDKTPSYEEIVSDPEGTPVPVESNLKWAVTSTIARKLDGPGFTAAAAYLKRIGRQYEAMALALGLHRNMKEIITSNLDAVKWMTANKDLFRLAV